MSVPAADELGTDPIARILPVIPDPDDPHGHRAAALAAIAATPGAARIGAEVHEGAGEPFATLDPATGAVIGHVAGADADTGLLDAAVAAARNAYRQGPWATMPRGARADLLRAMGETVRRHAGELAGIIALENGKTYTEALADDLPDTAAVFDYYAGWIDKLAGETLPVDPGFIAMTRRSPVGVCGLIVPWNFPTLLAAWKIAPALAAGNTVVIKPAPSTPWSILRLADLWAAEVGLPHGVVNVVPGGGPTGAAVAGHPGIDKVAFTGSTATGRAVVHAAADSNLKTVSLELGGKSPCLIFDDCVDPIGAADRVVDVLFAQKGEKCSQPTRLLVQAPLHDAVVDRLIARAGAVRVGQPFADDVDQGATHGPAQLAQILNAIELARSDGADVVAGGSAVDVPGAPGGSYVRPTVVTGVAPHHRLATEEVFGPVLAVQAFTDETEAIALANGTTYGLAAGVYTDDVSRAHRVADALDAGQVFVNRYGCYDLGVPFGGFRQSGWGKECGRDALDAYTKSKSVWIALR